MYENAILFGMSSEEFWHGNPQDFYIYGSAYQKKKQMEQKEMGEFAWVLGSYSMLAFAQVMHDAFNKQKMEIFPKKPPTNEVIDSKTIIERETLCIEIQSHNAKINEIVKRFGR